MGWATRRGQRSGSPVRGVSAGACGTAQVFFRPNHRVAIKK
jgi:hypothetical protein